MRDHFQAFKLHKRKPSFVVGLQGRYTRRIFTDLGLPETEYDSILDSVDKAKMNLGAWVGPKEEVSAEAFSGHETNNFLEELQARADLVSRLMRRTAEINGKRSWGFKILGDVIYADCYSSAWPNAIYILMIRDPRDHALSVMRLNEQRSARNQPNFYDDYKAAAQGWVQTIRDGRKVLQDNGLKYIEVKYENLVTDTQNELKRLGSTLGVDLYEAHDFYKQDFISRHTARFKHHNNLLNPVNTNSVGKWKTLMADKECAIFANVAGELMTELGYLE